MAKNTDSKNTNINIAEGDTRETLERLAQAQKFTTSIFGAGAELNAKTVFKFYDYLEMLNGAGVPESELITDFKFAYKTATQLFKTQSPEPEQVFGLFDRLFVGESE